MLIKKTIISVWSWKCISSSIIGEEASWKPICNGYAIEAYGCLVHDLILTRLCNSFTNTS